jgi:hypothetical protein
VKNRRLFSSDSSTSLSKGFPVFVVIGGAMAVVESNGLLTATWNFEKGVEVEKQRRSAL